MNKISNYAQTHFGTPSDQKEHGYMEENSQEKKKPQQSGKQQHIRINTVV